MLRSRALRLCELWPQAPFLPDWFDSELFPVASSCVVSCPLVKVIVMFNLLCMNIFFYNCITFVKNNKCTSACRLRKPKYIFCALVEKAPPSARGQNYFRQLVRSQSSCLLLGIGINRRETEVGAFCVCPTRPSLRILGDGNAAFPTCQAAAIPDPNLGHFKAAFFLSPPPPPP